jgi:hypothetical protein
MSTLARPGEGEHIAVLYTDPADRDATLIPYLAGALAAGDGAVCVTAVDPAVIHEQVRRAGPTTTDRVEVLGTEQTYLPGGSFSAPAMSSWLADLAAAAPRGSEAPRLRIAGDLAWVERLDDAGLGELFDYEAALDAFAPECRHTFACFYDLTRIPAAGVLDVLRTHPRALVNGVLWDSPFYRASA